MTCTLCRAASSRDSGDPLGKMPLLGSHLSVAGGLINALSAAVELKMDTVQVFTKNQRQWAAPPLDPGAAGEWRAELVRLGWQSRTVSHDSYLINLASPDEGPGGLWERSVASMRVEIERCAALSIPLLVSHPGAYIVREGGEEPQRIEQGLVRIARAYGRLFKETRGMPVTVCLECTAGGGTTLGRTFEELARLRELILSECGPDADLVGADGKRRVAGGRVGFCVDTCHALAAGYDIAARGAGADGKAGAGRARTRAQGVALGEAMLAAFDSVCGLEHLRVMHLNDSLGKMGSRLDRHAHIGTGEVAVGAFEAIVNHPKLAGVPMILETPKEDNEKGVPMDSVNLRKLRSMIKGARPAAGRRVGSDT
ncbi:MAG: deoxyribonuclease IV [Planctomycetota bacterium]|nr:deoxyribonuclease IV [Planctomycetota bacterium]